MQNKNKLRERLEGTIEENLEKLKKYALDGNLPEEDFTTTFNLIQLYGSVFPENKANEYLHFLNKICYIFKGGRNE